MSFNITYSGALFDGVAVTELKAAEAALQREIAEYAEFQWQMNMTESFQNPSEPPRYQSHVNIAKRGGDLVVNDGWPGSGLAYGPWLEGLGTRNATTKFKGYRSMERARNSVAQKVDAIAKPIIDKFTVAANAGI